MARSRFEIAANAIALAVVLAVNAMANIDEVATSLGTQVQRVLG